MSASPNSAGSGTTSMQTGCVISHTHWDREWYLPFEEFRIKLVDLIDRVLQILEEQPDYIFHLDAQAVVLEDYLEIRPHRREALARFIRKQRLLVGPWYVQNDLYLTSGEVTIRNLMIGSEISADFGHCSRAGYVPDQFGIISQFPQILRGFGIGDCIFGRGHVPPEGGKTEFIWRGPDGSEVVGIFMAHWYNNAQRFSADRDKALKYLRHVMDRAGAVAATPWLLLMNGVDHLEAQEDLLPILADLRGSLDGATVRQMSLDEYTRLVREHLEGREVALHEGEMRHGSDGSVLQGTLSSRVYLKTANARLQALIENQIEPLHAMLALAGHGGLYPADFTRYLWKELIKNHAHDSICGCSRDAVHAHMEDRFARIAECGNELAARGLRMWIERLDRGNLPEKAFVLFVANTTQLDREEAVTAILRFPVEAGMRAFHLRTPEGEPVAFEVLDHQTEVLTVFSPVNLPGQMEVDRFTVRTAPLRVPGLGHCALIAEQSGGAGAEVIAPPVWPHGGLVLANDALEVSITPEGGVSLRDKAGDRVFDNLFSMDDQGDGGDSYHYTALPDDIPMDLTASTPRVELLAMTPLEQSVRLTWTADIPARIDRAERRRGKERVPCDVAVELTLVQGRPWLDVRVVIDNRARDHRTRLLVKTGIQREASLSSAPFDFVERPVAPGPRDTRADRTEPTSGIMAVEQAGQGLAVFAEGLYGYEYLGDTDGTLAVTLLRANGAISGHTAFGKISQIWAAPDNQCLRRLEMRLAVTPWSGDRAALAAHYQAFLNPLLTGFDAVDSRVFTGGRHCVQDTELAELFYRDLPASDRQIPAAAQWVRVEGAVLSALKRAEQGHDLVVRVYNPGLADTTARLVFGVAVSGAKLLRLDETPCEPLALDDNAVSFPLPAGRIQTVGVML
jgi:alpha-mannosidase